MTMDGGGEAQLAVHAGETDLRVYGVTGLGLLQGPVPLPAIVAVRPRKATE
jgi:hypothetical protein